MSQRFAQCGTRAAFTLVEMIVSMTVLLIIVGFLGNLMSDAQRGTASVLRHMGAEAQARLVFDRMGNDFNRMLQRKDVDYIFAKAPAAGMNDAMFFFSRAPASINDPAASHGVTSLVGYRISPSFHLDRLGKLLNWDGNAAGATTPGGLPFLTFSGNALVPSTTINGIWGSGGSGSLGTAANGFSDGTDIDYSVLADGVFRLSFCFLQNTSSAGNTTSTYVYPPSPALPNAGTYPLDYVSNTQNVHVTAIVVTIGVLDQTARKLGAVTKTTVTALPDLAVPPVASSWNTALANPAFATTAGLAKQAAADVRVYEHTFYLNSPITIVTP